MGDKLTTENLIDIIRELGEKSEYEQQGNVFLEKTGTEFKVKFLRHDKHFADDQETRDIYEVTLTKGDRYYTFKFGQSINASGRFWKYGNYKRGIHHGVGAKHIKPMPMSEWDKNKNFAKPRPYDIFTGLTKYDPENFEYFCDEYGYDADSRKAEKIYEAVKDEYKNLLILFSDEEMDALKEIN